MNLKLRDLIIQLTKIAFSHSEAPDWSVSVGVKTSTNAREIRDVTAVGYDHREDRVNLATEESERYNEDLTEFKLPDAYRVKLSDETIEIAHNDPASNQNQEDENIFSAHQMSFRRPSIWTNGRLTLEEKEVIKMVCLRIYNFDCTNQIE